MPVVVDFFAGRPLFLGSALAWFFVVAGSGLAIAGLFFGGRPRLFGVTSASSFCAFDGGRFVTEDLLLVKLY